MFYEVPIKSNVVFIPAKCRELMQRNFAFRLIQNFKGIFNANLIQIIMKCMTGNLFEALAKLFFWNVREFRHVVQRKRPVVIGLYVVNTIHD